MPEMELNPRGIPRAPFVSNVSDYVGAQESPEAVIKAFQETSAKYRYMEVNLQQRRRALEGKIPEFRETLGVVRFLQRRHEGGGDDDDDDEDGLGDGEDEEEGEGGERKRGKKLKTLFELNDTLYAEAELDENGQVGLWLGANTMLLYPLAEAAALLDGKLAAALKSLDEVVEDLEWIREQVTVMEVNFARVHNS
ncbi:hypothetical protein Q5752_000266 [Cryptotrichosporon argae]